MNTAKLTNILEAAVEGVCTIVAIILLLPVALLFSPIILLILWAADDFRKATWDCNVHDDLEAQVKAASNNSSSTE